MITISKELKEKYDTQYSDNTEKWRKIGAIGKVQNIIDLTKGLKINKIIDIGAGDGNILSLLSERNYCSELTAVEISDSAISQIKKKEIPGLIEIKQFDGYNLPFRDKQFDLAICSHVIEHVEHPRKLLSEIKRISKKQVFEVPIDFSFHVDKKFKHYNSYGHINIFTPSLFNFLLYTVGFEILNYKYALYKKEVVYFENKKFSINYLKIMIKRLVLKTIPILMKIKPNTYAVLTK
jgi:ubiquinone/menaquinone biosynthesis C-methylase UbiE